MNNKTIFALATPYAQAAIHIIRISGTNSYKIVNSICKNKVIKKGYTIERNQVIDKKNKRIIDDVLLMKFVNPKSYTGEDLIEINCHGGIKIVNDIISLLTVSGAEQAQEGEFTKRAFFNNKIDLTQALAVDALVKSKNVYTHDSAMSSLLGKTSSLLKSIQLKLFDIIGRFEIGIDYPEYEEGNVIFDNTLKDIIKIKNNLEEILKDSKRLIVSNDGIKIILVGKPNVGKSSLLNALINQERVLVSNISGTTRDVIEINLQIGNFNIKLLDTAGIHKAESKLEKLGIQKTLDAIKIADLVIVVLSAVNKISKEENNLIESLKQQNKDYLVVYNKKDLVKKNKQDLNKIFISAKNKEIITLIKAIEKYLANKDFSYKNLALLNNNWQIDLLAKAIIKLEEFINIVKKSPYLDILIEPIKEANEILLKIIGEIKDYDLLTEIFKTFCLGK